MVATFGLHAKTICLPLWISYLPVQSIGMQNSGNSDEGGRMGLVGRLKYDFDSRYYIEGSFRYDGSDNFAPGHRWGFFPSVALAGISRKSHSLRISI